MATVDQRFDKLLIIDDEPGIRKMMSLDLSADGYQVFTAANGREGLEIFERERPPLVLTDLKMPGMDGIEVLRRLKERSSDTEVIVITGHGDMDLAIKSLRLDASDFITKPISGEALEVALRRATQRLAMRAELKTYTRELEQRVADATAQALAAERLAAVGQTVSSLVHSIKNMLAGLKGGTYLVKEGREQNSNKMIDHGLEMLQRNVRRVGALVYDLLTLAKPRQPKVEQVDAGELAAEVVELLGPEAEQKGVDLGLEPPAESLGLEADRRSVVDGLTNLVCNALDAASTKSDGWVRVRLQSTPQELAFEVEDNGPGLEEEAEERIFEGFYSSKGASGTGLGLMVTQKHAREHGGRVDYDNRPGQGVTFWLVLPRRQPDVGADNPERPEEIW
jgi:signal transduction histidine kinase